MAKKKQSKNIIYEIDKSLDKKYQDIIEEIHFMQEDIRRAERKARKKAYKRMKKGNTFFDTRMELDVRKQVIREMEGNDFFGRVSSIINELKPICVIIARLVMSLIVSILSIDAIKMRIQPNTLNKLHSVYNLAKSVSVG